MIESCVRSVFGTVVSWSLFILPQTATAYTGQPEADPGAPVNTDETAPLPQSSWEALVGSQVELTRSDGNVVAGQLLELDESSATLVKSDGTVVALAVTDVIAVRRVDPSESPPASAPPPTG